MLVPHHSVFTGQMPFLPPTNSVKALKALKTDTLLLYKFTLLLFRG